MQNFRSLTHFTWQKSNFCLAVLKEYLKQNWDDATETEDCKCGAEDAERQRRSGLGEHIPISLNPNST